jgi:probable sporulation protein (polysaccharide deacetylase family)
MGKNFREGKKGMKVFFISKKMLIGTTAGLLMMGGCLLLFLLVFSSSGQASKIKQPIYQGNSGLKAVALNVNVDWGEEYIPEMLKILQSYKTKVTFFVTGQWAEKNPELLKQMHAEGHSIQNHGYKHVHFNSLSEQEIREQIRKTQEVINNLLGTDTVLFASPYGEINRNIMSVVSSLDYDLIMWSVDTVDWQRPSPDTIVKRVMNKVQNDAIILMHPTEPTVKALPDMLQKLLDEEYKIVTVQELIATEVQHD